MAGLPVITTDVCGFAPFVLEADAGLVIESPFRQVELDVAVGASLQDADQRSRWSANGIDYGDRDTLFEMPVKAVDFIAEQLNA